uniref:Uncharacterized protein n=1 Tax=Nelumbo nucifera TaxID=4432 RepID=A0A822ZM95_NELNU|nr:TPA_asm: hypothetical protein HUJ06_001118 [Nelumbo nucifera]
MCQTGPIASRPFLLAGWVKSSHGSITTQSHQYFSYRNTMKFENNRNEQIVNQTTDVNANVYSRLPSHLDFIDLSRRFPLYLYTNFVDQGNGTSTSISNLSLGFNQQLFSHGSFGFSRGNLVNL